MRRGKRKTIREVAERAGVSTATVSNVLNGKGRVSKEVEDRVRQAARALGFRIDRAAAQLRSGRSNVVAAIVPALDNPFFTSLIAAFERHVSAAGFDLIVASANEDENTEEARLAALLSWRPAGVFVVPCVDDFAACELIEKAAVPFVIVDRAEDNPKTDCVLADNFGAGRDAAAHLFSLGHRRILIVASSLALANVRERCAGIQDAAAAYQAPHAEVLEIGVTFEHAAGRLARWVEVNGAPDGLIALTNFATLGAVFGCARLSLAIPRDVSLVGFDDYEWMQASSPSITAVRQPVDRMGETAWQCLKDRIGGLGGPPRQLRLPCQLEIRNSAVARTRDEVQNGPTGSAGLIHVRS